MQSKADNSKKLDSFQQAARISLKQNALKIDDFRGMPESVLGAGGRAFESPRPDQIFQQHTAHL
jgi:hypothetical protein